jgi:hypothetical protein
MRGLAVITILYAVLHCSAQDVEPVRKFKYELGMQNLIGGADGASFSGYARVRYDFLQLGILSGTKSLFVENKHGFDEVYSQGYWVEPSFSLILPTLSGRKKQISVNQNSYVKLSASVGFARSNNEFRNVFTSLGPYQDYVNSFAFTNRTSRYARFSVGLHQEFWKRISVGYGLSILRTWDADDIVPSSPAMPFVITPLNGTSNVGLHIDLGIVLN